MEFPLYFNKDKKKNIFFENYKKFNLKFLILIIKIKFIFDLMKSKKNLT